MNISRLLRLLPLWKRLPNTLVNTGMGGEEECRLYQHRITKTFKCVTRDHLCGNWSFATFHDNW